MKQQHEFIDAELTADIQAAMELYKFAPEWIYKELKEKKIIKRGYKIPSEKTLRIISLFFLDQHHCFTLQNSDQFIEYQNQKNLFMRSIQTSLECATFFKHSAEQRIQRLKSLGRNRAVYNFDDFINNSLIPNLEKWDVFISSVSSISQCRDLVISQQDDKALIPVHWHSFAFAAAEMFRSAVSESNPGRAPLGNSYTGPVGQFMALIIPHITGETPRAETVAKHIQEVSRRNLSA